MAARLRVRFSPCACRCFANCNRFQQNERGRLRESGKEFRAEPSPEHLERGRYLVEGAAHCFMCHGEQDYAHASSLPLPGRKGVGKALQGELYDGVFSPEGLVCPNITPDKETGAGTWTDAQFERAIRHGIGHDGR